MQASSPLAALQAHQVPFGHAHGHWNLRLGSNARSGSSCATDFNFREISMQTSAVPSKRDYFTMKPSHRGSSPAATLATDMSQNCHIASSPLFPTPRRSLLEIFGQDDRQDMITPPPPATSPCPEIEMDATPLVHKPAFIAQIHVQSPTPEPSPMEDADTLMVTSPIDFPASPLNNVHVLEIKKIKARPSRLRPDMKKSWSHCGVSLRTAPLEKPAPFLFGHHLTTSTNLGTYKPSLPMTLDEAFEDSPEKENVRFAMSSLETTPVAAPRPRSANQNRMFGSPMNGSPIGPLQRRPGAIKRPRTSYRRSNSMFEHPDKWLNDKKSEMCMEAIAESTTQPELILPHFYSCEESLPRISQETLIDVLDGKYASQIDVSNIVDCRFEYEFEGGHINGAQNCTDREGFATTFWSDNATQTGRTLMIFHCEFSEKRAPTTAMHFRSKDREMNAHRYPFLSYPDVYILDGGYSAFFKQHKARCYPQQHVAMEDEKHAEACERGLGRIKRPNKLSRAQTFAFGEREKDLNDSPTALPRSTSFQIPCMALTMPSPSTSVSIGGYGNAIAARRALGTMRSISH